MYGIDSGNGYVYGNDPAVEHIEKDKSEKEGKDNSQNEPSYRD